MNIIQKLSVVLLVLALALIALNYHRIKDPSEEYLKPVKRKALFFQIGLLMLAIAIVFFMVGTYVVE